MAINVSSAVTEATVDDIFSVVDRADAPGAAIGIAVKGVPIYRKGFGLATVGSPSVLSCRTRMRIFSVTKHFVCLAYLLLCEQGKAGLDDPIGKYLAKLPRASCAVSVRQLMSHTSGILDIEDMRLGLGNGDQCLHCSDVVAMYEEFNEVNFRPDVMWCYNNGAFVLLGAIIERLSDRPLEDVLRAGVFEPVGMTDTMLLRWDQDLTRECATEHTRAMDGRYIRTSIPGEHSGDGGVVSTVDDMLRWLAHMEAPVVGRPDTWALMRTPGRLGTGAGTGYGLGLDVTSYRGAETVGHSGGGYGGTAQMITVPGAGFDVIVMANMRDVSSEDLAYRVVDACIAGFRDVSRRPELECAEGTFLGTRTGRVIQLLVRNGRQHVLGSGAHTDLFWSDSMGVLRPTLPMGCAVWILGNRARPQAIRVHDHGGVEEFRAVAPAAGASAQSIAGVYRSGFGGARVAISPDGDGARMESRGRFGSGTYRLQALAENLWRFEETSGGGLVGVGVLSFGNGGQGFTWITERTWNMPFSRIE